MSKSIKVINGGPLKVSGFSSVEFAGNSIPLDGDAFLCRCGGTKNPPFCDATHKKVGFTGANERDKTFDVRDWEGQTIETFFNANICMHARACKPLKELRKRETEGDASAAKEIAATVTDCPSGALTYRMKDGTVPVAFENQDSLVIDSGGAIQVRCETTRDGLELQERQPENRLTLCRCGASKNKPFCDGSHEKREGFR